MALNTLAPLSDVTNAEDCFKSAGSQKYIEEAHWVPVLSRLYLWRVAGASQVTLRRWNIAIVKTLSPFERGTRGPKNISDTEI